MATKRIIAYFMHENEQYAAEQEMSPFRSTDSYVIGNIDETQIAGLESKGLIVQELSDASQPPLADLSPALATAGARSRMETPSVDLDPTQPGIYTIRLAGPLLEEWRDQLAVQGVQIIESIGPQHYTALLQPDQVAPLRSLDFVTQISLHADSEKNPPIPKARAGSPPHPGVERVRTYDIRLRDPANADTVLSFLSQRDVLVAGTRGRKIRIHLKEESPVLAELGAMPDVYEIQEFVPPKLSNDRARILLGIDAAGSSVTTIIPFDGNGQIVGIADTGIDDQHPDFRGRLVGISALGRPNDHSDPNGHGTHVAGSVGGDGTASNGSIRGTAPRANIFFQSIMDAQGELGGLPWDLHDLFDEAYQAGARIHNNSWGAATDSRYTFNSIEADEFVETHRDMAIVIAAGNEGTAHSPFNAQVGFVDWLSVGSPATSKNAVTVGASRTDRTSGGFSSLTWNQAWPQDYPVPPIGAENISGDPESMAAFSSRGPCDDRRIKPDVVAPGTDIVSTKSSRAPLANFWGSFPGHTGRYAYMGGTSMAAPIVSGCLALIRQYYVEKRGHDPSAALLKATLVNSTRRLTGADSTADFANLPNFHQGFGCIHMPWAVPNNNQPDLRLEFLDNWQSGTPPKFTVTGERVRYRIGAGDRRPLRFCLAYTDLPARALQNNLNLFVQSLATGQKWVGNEALPMRLGRVDDENNVEIVRIEAPPQGDFLVQISASNLLSSSGQDYALVVTGDLTSTLTVF
jgi:subtilisin family serine protease